MASNFEKPPFFKLYLGNGMLRQSSPRFTSCRATILRSNTRPKATRIRAPWESSSRSIERSRISSRIPQESIAEFGNVLQGCLLRNWKQILSDHVPEPVDLETVLPTHDRSSAENFSRAISLFLMRTFNKKKPRDRQYIYMVPGGDHGIHKDLMTQPLDHLHWFQEMLRTVELLLEGDIASPNDALQVEWFYTSFHKSDRSEYVRRRRRLCDETLTTFAQYFESIHNARVGNGLLQRKREDQIRQAARREYHHELQSRYHDKLKHIVDKRVRGNGQSNRDNNLTRDYKSRDRHFFYRDQRKMDDKNRRGDRKTPPEGSTKKPCHVHGPDSKHSFSECHANPRNQRSASNNNNYSKRVHNSHYQDDRHRSSNDESREDPVMSVASIEGEVSTNASVADRSHDNYHLDNFHIPK
jgi:hypothetical protein